MGHRRSEEYEDQNWSSTNVRFETNNHLQILFRLHASVWKNVLPMCLLNTAIVLSIYYFDLDVDGWNVSITDSGHVFMSLMVSYLIISRLHTSLNRYMDARKYLSHIIKSSRDLIQETVAFTKFGKNHGHHPKAMEWRVGIAKRLNSLLKVMVTNLERISTNDHEWIYEELSETEKDAIEIAVGKAKYRAPFVLNIFLRSVIADHGTKLPKKLEAVQELRLLDHTTDIIYAYNNIMKDVDTPYPFPLVQMTRTFLFIWIFTLPFALSTDIDEIIPLSFVIFFLTYGFLGIELISIEMDDPFGDDENDFDVRRLFNVVYDDIAGYIYDVDGKDACKLLNRKKTNKVATNTRPRCVAIDNPTNKNEEEISETHPLIKKVDRNTNTIQKSPMREKQDRFLFISRLEHSGDLSRDSEEDQDQDLLNSDSFHLPEPCLSVSRQTSNAVSHDSHIYSSSEVLKLTRDLILRQYSPPTISLRLSNITDLSNDINNDTSQDGSPHSSKHLNCTSGMNEEMSTGTSEATCINNIDEQIMSPLSQGSTSFSNFHTCRHDEIAAFKKQASGIGDSDSLLSQESSLSDENSVGSDDSGLSNGSESKIELEVRSGGSDLSDGTEVNIELERR